VSQLNTSVQNELLLFKGGPYLVCIKASLIRSLSNISRSSRTYYSARTMYEKLTVYKIPGQEISDKEYFFTLNILLCFYFYCFKMFVFLSPFTVTFASEYH